MTSGCGKWDISNRNPHFYSLWKVAAPERFYYYIWSVPKTGFQILAVLALWIFSIQGQYAFASLPEAVQIKADAGSELKETPGHGHAYLDQRNTLRVEPGPQKEFSDFLSTFPANNLRSPEDREAEKGTCNVYLRDVRHCLSCQIFPFHFFW